MGGKEKLALARWFGGQRHMLRKPDDLNLVLEPQDPYSEMRDRESRQETLWPSSSGI